MIQSGLCHRRLLLGVEPTGGESLARFYDNMVIIVAALPCALICLLMLNSILRCALRCCRRRIALEAPDAATGLKKRVLREIPVSVHGVGEAAPGSSDCPICLGEFALGDKVRVLPMCRHQFHVRCIDTWLASHSSCPTCRGSVVGRPVAAGAGEAGNRTAEGETDRLPYMPYAKNFHNPIEKKI